MRSELRFKFRQLEGESSLVGEEPTHADERFYYEDTDLNRPLRPQDAGKHHRTVLSECLR